MPKIRNHLYFISLISILLFSCSTPPSPPLRLGTNVWPGYEPLYLARSEGYLSRDKVHLVEFSSSSQTMQSFRNGLIDAAALTLDEVLLLQGSGEKLKIILVTDISAGGDVIIGQPDIKQLADIKAKRIGVENNALGAYVITRALEIAGLNKDDIHLVQLEINEQLNAFKQHKVDAVVTFDPVRSQLLKMGGKQLFDSRQIPNEIVDVVVVREDYLKRYPEQLQYLLDGWYRALDMLKKQPQKSAEILSQRMKLSPADTLASYDGLILPSPRQNQALLQQQTPELLKTVKKLSAIMVKESLLKSAAPPSQLFSQNKLQHRPPMRAGNVEK